jgi:energy-coupling factor transport system ATP-binding protein
MLDPKGRYDVLNALLSLRKKKGTTLILVTHFMPETIPADRILVMNNGTIAMDDNPREVFNQAEKLKMMGLDIPQVSEIALRLRKHGLELSKGIITVEELVDELCRLKSEM